MSGDQVSCPKCANRINDAQVQTRTSRAAMTIFRNYRIRAQFYAGKPNWDLLATIAPR